MDIHKPKPWHGWREFLKEYLIIVAGIVTALLGDQGVEQLRRGAEVREARAALHDEIATDAAIAARSIEPAHCYAAQLDAGDAWARGGPRPPEVSLLGLTMLSTTWETAKTGAVTHMPLKERLGLAAFYNGASGHQRIIVAEEDAYLALRVFWAHSELDKDTAARLLETIKRARVLNDVHIISSRQVVADAAAVGVKPKTLTGAFQAILAQACGAAVPSATGK